MRDPELVFKAQLAAAALERAWQRWRLVHGLVADPMPAVSSYVGYSLEEPWGQPRVVLGLASSDAEHLAALLERHDCIGPVHAMIAAEAGEGAVDVVGEDEKPLPVPRQAPSLLAEQVTSGNGRSVLKPSSWRADSEDGPVYRQVAAARWASVAAAVGEAVTVDEAEAVVSEVIAAEPAGTHVIEPAEQAAETAAEVVTRERGAAQEASEQVAGQDEVLSTAARQEEPSEDLAAAVTAASDSATSTATGAVRIAGAQADDTAEIVGVASEANAAIEDAAAGDEAPGEDASPADRPGARGEDARAAVSSAAGEDASPAAQSGARKDVRPAAQGAPRKDARPAAQGAARKDARRGAQSAVGEPARAAAAASREALQDDPESAESADDETPGPLTLAASTAKSEAEARIREAKRQRRAAAQRAARPEGSQPEGSQPEGSRPEGSQPEGSQPEGSRPEGSRPDGTHAEGSEPAGEGGDNATEPAEDVTHAPVTGVEQTSEAPTGRGEELAVDGDNQSDAITVRPPESAPRGRQHGRGRRNRSGRGYPIPRLPKSKRSGAVPGS